MTIDPKQPAVGSAIDPRPVGSSETASVSRWKPGAYLAILAGLLSLFAGSMLATRADRALTDVSPDVRPESAPPDVTTLARRIVECRQWLNFAGIDEATDRAVQGAVIHLRCDTLAVDLAKMRRKFALWPAVLQALDAASDTRRDIDL
jgi:hypothetical protein